MSNPIAITAQAAAQQLNAAMAYYYQAAAANDHVQAQKQADFVNCFRKILSMPVFIPWNGYVPPSDCSAIANVTLAPSTVTPGSLVQEQSFAFSNTANGPEVLSSPVSLAISIGGGCDPEDPGYCCYYPDDPLCTGRGIGIGGGGGGGGVGTIINNYYDTINNYYTSGVSNAEVSNLIDGSLASLWSVVVSSIDGAIVAAIAEIQAAITAIGNALKGIFSVLSKLAGLILKAIQSIWQQIIKGLASLARKIFNLLSDIWNKVIVPLMKALSAIRKKLLEIYERFIRPVLIILQTIRRVLAILKIFHIKWAAKLDNVLADIQNRISGTFLYLLAYTNAIANWINLIMTVGYLIQKPIWLLSLNGYKGSTTALVVNAMTDHSPAGSATVGSSVPSTSQSAAAGLQYMRTQTGPYAVLIGQENQQLQTYLQQGL